MSLLGPQNLFTLTAPKLVWDENGVAAFEATSPQGTFYEVIAQRSQVTVYDLIEALKHFHGDSLLRDVFADDDDLCINFWKAA